MMLCHYRMIHICQSVCLVLLILVKSSDGMLMLALIRLKYIPKLYTYTSNLTII